MVERKFNSLQREIFNFSSTTINIKLRCIITRLVTKLLGPDNKGAWSMEERKIHINVLGLKAAKLAITFSNSRKRMQYQFRCKNQKLTGNTFETKDHNYCLILARVNECRGRQGIQVNQWFKRMETKPSILHEIVSDKRNSRDASHQLPQYISWKIDLLVRAGMLFRYPGLTIFCMLFPILHF